jgi:uncharacterized iron-regulated protein
MIFSPLLVRRVGKSQFYDRQILESLKEGNQIVQVTTQGLFKLILNKDGTITKQFIRGWE